MEAEEITKTIWDFGSNVFDNGLLVFAIQAAVTWMIARLLVKILKKFSDKAEASRLARHQMPLNYVYQTLKFLIWFAAIFSILSSIKPMAKLGTAALGATSIVAVGVSLAAQDSFSNYISGFFLSIYQPFTAGDIIKIQDGSDDKEGTVEEITVRHTVIRTWNNSTLIIPNSVMNTAAVENYGKDTPYTKYITVGVDYSSDMDLVKRVINEVVENHPECIDTRTAEEKAKGKDPAGVRLEAFEDSDLLIKFGITVPSYAVSFRVAGEVRRNVLEAFRKNNINIPFPIRTIIQEKN